MKKQICCACLAVLILLLAGCTNSIPQRNYVGMTRGEVAAVLEKEAFRSRWSRNSFVIQLSKSGIATSYWIHNAGEVVCNQSLMFSEQWRCDFYPQRHWLLGWHALSAVWHYKTLSFREGKVVKQEKGAYPYIWYGRGGVSPYPQHPKNFHKVNDEIYRSAQPDEDEMSSMSTFECIRSVLNLREKHSDKDEIGKLKLTLYEIPLEAGKITEADLVRILRTVKYAPKPILIHCRHGSDRTGVAVAACRIVFDYWTVDQAVSELTDPKYGHHKKLFPNLPEILRKADWNKIRRDLNREKPDWTDRSNPLRRVPELENRIRTRLQNDNPNWKCTVENFSLFAAPRGLNIMITGPGISNLSALADHDFDTVLLIDTEIANTDFLKNSRSLRVLAIKNGKDNGREIDLSGLKNKDLKSLFLTNVRIAGLAPIRDLKLSILSLHKVKGIDCAGFTDLHELESFTAVDMDIRDIGFLCRSPKLRYLHLSPENSVDLSVLPEPVRERVRTKEFRILR